MNLFVISNISWGSVAEIKQTYIVKTQQFREHDILDTTSVIRSKDLEVVIS